MNITGNKTKRTNAGGSTKSKTKKFGVGGYMDTDFSIGPSGGGATGEVKKISQSAQAAAKQLGQAGAAIGGGGGGGGGSLIPGLPSPGLPSPGLPSPGFPFPGFVQPPIDAPSTYKKGGQVRGYGKARGGRACKMV